MNHKHIEVIIEELQYSLTIDAWDAINDLIDYVECVEEGDGEKHYPNCILTEATPSKGDSDV